MMFFDGLVGLFTGKLIYATFELVFRRLIKSLINNLVVMRLRDMYN